MIYYKFLRLESIFYFCEIDYVFKTEQWTALKGYPYYEVSDLGRIKAIERTEPMTINNCLRTRKAKILKNNTCNKYLSICVYLHKKPKTVLVHRLVLISFIENIENKREVNHINCIKTDNRLLNLEWSTSSENTIHAIKNGLINQKRGQDIVTSKLTQKEAIDIKYSVLKNCELVRKYNISPSVVSSIRKNKSWKHI